MKKEELFIELSKKLGLNNEVAEGIFKSIYLDDDNIIQQVLYDIENGLLNKRTEDGKTFIEYLDGNLYQQKFFQVDDNNQVKLARNDYMSYQEILLVQEGDKFIEMARDNNPINIEDVLPEGKIFLKIGMPNSMKKDRPANLIGLSDSEYEVFKSMLLETGGKFEINRKLLEKCLFIPDSLIHPIATNDKQLLNSYDLAIELCNEHKQLLNSYDLAIELCNEHEKMVVLSDNKERLIKNSFPEIKKLEEISQLLCDLSGRLNTVQLQFPNLDILNNESKVERKKGKTADGEQREASAVKESFSESRKSENQENLKDKQSSSEDIDTILIRAEGLLQKTTEIEGKATVYKKDGLDNSSLEVKGLMQEISGLQSEILDIQKVIEKKSEDAIKQISENEQSEKAEKMQVIVVNDNGLYKEITSATNPQHFLSQNEIDKIAERYSGQKVFAIEVDKTKYQSISGTTPEIIEARDKLLKAEGNITFSKESKKQEEQTQKSVKPEKSAIDDKIRKISERENRNGLDAILDYFRLLGLMLTDIFAGTKKQAKAVIPEKKPETQIPEIQVVAVQQTDGTVMELKSISNKNLFFQSQDLKAFAESLTNTTGKFVLLNIPSDKYPDVSKYLQKGIMTEEGKVKYQEEKNEFLKKQMKNGVTYEVNERKESKTVIEKPKEQIQKTEKYHQVTAQKTKQNNKNGKGRMKRR